MDGKQRPALTRTHQGIAPGCETRILGRMRRRGHFRRHDRSAGTNPAQSIVAIARQIRTKRQGCGQHRAPAYIGHPSSSGHVGCVFGTIRRLVFHRALCPHELLPVQCRRIGHPGFQRHGVRTRLHGIVQGTAHRKTKQDVVGGLHQSINQSIKRCIYC